MWPYLFCSSFDAYSQRISTAMIQCLFCAELRDPLYLQLGIYPGSISDACCMNMKTGVVPRLVLSHGTRLERLLTTTFLV